MRVRIWGGLVGLLLAATAGCAPVYHPNSAPAPMLREQGEVQVGGYATTSGMEARAAAAVTDHVAVLGAVAFGNAEQQRCLDLSQVPCDEVPDDYRRHRFAEGALGYTTMFSPVAGGSVYAGFGGGWAESTDYQELLSQSVQGPHRAVARGHYLRAFVQPSVFLDFGPVQLHHASRFTRVHFYAFESSRAGWDGTYGQYFWEPAVTVRAGPDPVSFSIQTGVAVPFQRNVQYEYQRFTIAVGALVRVNRLF